MPDDQNNAVNTINPSMFKKHWVGALIAVIMSTITGTITPMISQWHSDKVASDQVSQIQSQFQKELDNQAADHERDMDRMTAENSKVWKYIQEDEISMTRAGIIISHRD